MRAAGAELVKQRRPKRVAPDVFDVEVVEILERAEEGSVKGHLGSATVVPFASAEVREEGAAAVGIKEGGGEEEGAGRRGR